MPRKRPVPTIPYANVGETVTADNGLRYVIMRVEGARAWMKHPDPDGKIGPGRPRFGIMVGDPTNTAIPESADSEMAGVVTAPKRIELDIL